MVQLYRLALERTPSAEERANWSSAVSSGGMTSVSVALTILNSAEADAVRNRSALVPEVADGRYVQFLYATFLNRSPIAFEIAYWSNQLRQQSLDRSKLALTLFSRFAVKALGTQVVEPNNDPSLAPRMGRDNEFFDANVWEGTAKSLRSSAPQFQPRVFPSLALGTPDELAISIITSLYKGGAYIEQFLKNITQQSIFTKHCELIVIDADSPEGEEAAIATYARQFPNIIYHRAASRIGIYEAWNLGVQLARGRYLTNANLDDLRRIDSLERQMEIFEKFPFVDIVYQDFFYSFDGHAPFDLSAAVGMISDVPIVTANNLMHSNSPHNAPMWRRSLHDELGLFDTSYRSAGDYDFWLRCVEKKKCFFKMNDPHVVYYVNPEGLSTQPDTRGIDEAAQITLRHGAQVISEALLGSDEEFEARLARITGAHVDIPEALKDTVHWRYSAAQLALRQWSSASRRSQAKGLN
ncbi:glycosyltransferase [Xenophilus aerolatus]|nr:DUF4214 domain-containing protein [Xenophilus aerolatus]